MMINIQQGSADDSNGNQILPFIAKPVPGRAADGRDEIMPDTVAIPALAYRTR
jgi:hypothetical protein